MDGGGHSVPPSSAASLRLAPIDVAAESHLQAQTARTAPPSIAEGFARHPEFSVLSPSARTSYTRVDLSSADVGPGRRGQDGDGDEGGDGGFDGVGDDELQGPEEVEAAVPPIAQVSLTFLLVSGRRRTMSFDRETTVGRVKELVWNAWPNEWQDERPPAPSYLRILYLGKILQDDDTLEKVGFSTYVPPTAAGASSEPPRPATPPPSTIVHLSIRSYAPPGSEDSPKKKSRRRRRSRSDGAPGEGEEEEEGAGCCSACCVVC